MIIPQHNLDNHLKKGCAPVYWVVGQDPYLFNQTVRAIKQAWQRCTQQNSEETVIDILQSQNWQEGFQDANTYSLFSEHRLLDLRFAKKTLDAAGKKAIQAYLDRPNPRCLVLIQAPELPVKQIQTLVAHPQVACIQIMPYTPVQFKKFIAQRLQALQIQATPDVPEVIYQYHQANLLACNQFLELLACMHDLSQPLTTDILMTYLRDQSEFSIYELGEACLRGQTTHAIHVFRKIQEAQGEPILVLWVLNQEIRKLVQIHHLQASQPFQAICQQLKIWSQKIPLYQKAWQRVSGPQACDLLKRCQSLDEQMKSNRSGLIWQELENLVVLLSN
ncbi:MAG: DNA polymerase III subunit delta [Gammaproteobacteria bacterium]|jgi:DNA polymerase-3 subunit delta